MFDLGTYYGAKGFGKSGFQSLGLAFGLPQCILDLAQSALALLPSDTLISLTNEIEQARSKAINEINEYIKNLMAKTGIIEYDTETGTLKFKINAISNQSNAFAALGNLGSLLAGFEAVLQTGAALYANYEIIAAEIEKIKECLESLFNARKFEGGTSGKTQAQLEAEYLTAKAQLNALNNFKDKCDKALDTINSILAERELNPALEPVFSDASYLDEALSGSTFKRFAVDDTPQPPVFRLSFGPPESTQGYFLLTKDGLYYDSQKGGINPILVNINSKIVPDGDKWKYEHEPNLGGKGQSITVESFIKYKDTLFDPKIIDESTFLQSHYEADPLLQNLLDARNKHIYDLSSGLQVQLTANGNLENSITKNLRLALTSELENHNSKIRRRKKQIEIAVKAPNIFEKVSTDPYATVVSFKKGEIPVNDFSYLNQLNFGVEFEKQRKLIFEQAEVSGIVLPIETKYALPPVRPTNPAQTSHLIVPEIGIGDIIYSQLGTSSVVHSLTDTVVTENLFGIYNFLQPEVVQPSSNVFKINNSITGKNINDVQLVSNYASSVFVSGLSIPYLNGIVKNSSVINSYTSALGSFIRLPDTKEFQDLLYDPNGFTIECWVHAPNLNNSTTGWLSNSTSSLTRVLLANENTGVKSGYSSTNSGGILLDLDYLAPDRGDLVTRGVVIGFTRDRRITQNLGYSDLDADNPVGDTHFFMAPTQARDLSSCSWVNNTGCTEETAYHAMKFKCSTRIGTKKFADASSSFILVDIVGDPKNDQIDFYCDGQLMATSSISTCFGVPKYSTIDLPSFRKTNSFEYSTSSVDGPLSVQNGPKLNPFYTPWIVGGGYTDGMSDYGNFMGGGSRGGVVSGLRGFIGSLKFYNKPLNSNEVLKNYNAQSVYFKNIRV